MATTTPRFGLTKHTDADPFVTEEIAANWQSVNDKIEGWLPPDTFINRPSPSEELRGFLFWAHDVGQVFVCVDVGSGTYGWKSTGVASHDQLTIDDPDPHPQYVRSADHTKAVHDAMGIDAATLEGEDLAGMAGRHLYTETKSSDTWVSLDQNAYFNVLSLTLAPPFATGAARYKVAAFGAVWMNCEDASSEGRARTVIDGVVGTSTFMAIGTGAKSVPAADEVEDRYSIEINVRLEAKDVAGAGLVESSSLYVVAMRMA